MFGRNGDRPGGADRPWPAAKRAAPLMAMLLDSVAPEVKMISRMSAPIRAATWARARLHGGLGSLAHDMFGTVRIAVVLGEERQHGLDDARIAAGGGLVIQIDGLVRARRRSVMPAELGSCRVRDQSGAQPSSHARIGGGEGVDIGLGHVPRQRDADRLAGQRAQAHRLQHVAGLHLA